MKNYLLNEYRVVPSFTKKGKKSYFLLNMISVALFVLGALLFFSALYMVCNMIGSIVSGTPKAALHELIRVFPILLADFGVIYLAAFVHNWTAPKTEEKFRKNVMKNAIICMVIGAIIVLYVVIGLIAKLYHGIVEGYPTKLFPLDLLIGGVLYLALGICLFVFRKKINLGLPYEDHKSNSFFGVLRTMQYMGTLFAFAAIIYSIRIVDWNHGHIFYSLMLELLFVLMVAMACVYKFVYSPLKKAEKNTFQLIASVCFLVINVVAFVLYVVAFSNDLAAPSDAWYGVLSVDFTASFNAVTYLYGVMLIFAPLIALIRALVAKKKAK